MSIRVQEFFDGIATSWDGWQDLEVEAGRLASGLVEFGIGLNETVVDLGCGTGNLTTVLLKHLSPSGKVISVDFSPGMLAVAQSKMHDPRIRWIEADAQSLPLPDDSVDRVICYSTWPHFRDPTAVAREVHRILHAGGHVHIWHLVGRDVINRIHSGAGDPILNDFLHPAKEVAALLNKHQFQITHMTDEADKYSIVALKPTGLK